MARPNRGNAPRQQTIHGDPSPPPYQVEALHPTPALTTSPVSTPPPLPPPREITQEPAPVGNFISINSPQKHIVGCWSIDTSLQVPASLLATIPKDQTRPNLSLIRSGGVWSFRGSIDAEIELVRGSKDEMALIVVENGSGDVMLKIKNKKGQKHRIEVTAGSGMIAIQLPRTFHGLITLYSPIHDLSPEISRKLIRIHENHAEVKWILGGLAGVKLDESCMGDELIAKALTGRVALSYFGEDWRLESPGTSQIKSDVEQVHYVNIVTWIQSLLLISAVIYSIVIGMSSLFGLCIVFGLLLLFHRGNFVS